MGVVDGGAESEPRLCDYTGKFYCNRCHWNDEMMIPARVVHNWDGEKRRVCRATKQLLTVRRARGEARVQVVDRKPLIDLALLNPVLFKFEQQLETMQRLRRDLLLMKCYFLCCKVFVSSVAFPPPPHFMFDIKATKFFT
jgi:hypothetical protein